MHLLHNCCAKAALILCGSAHYVCTISSQVESKTMFARIATRLKQYRDHQKTVSLLAHMDDRQLSDIGVNRGDIDLVVRRGRLTF